LQLVPTHAARIINIPGIAAGSLHASEPFLSDDPLLEPIKQNTSTIAAIVETCYNFLISHQMIGEKWGLPFHFYRPSLQKYGPYQWLWDSGCHMMVWSHRNVSNSIADMRTMLQMQQPDGRIPELIFWGPQSDWDLILLSLQYSTTKYVDLTQMPLLPFALRAIWNITRDVSLLKEFVPKLVRYFDWWARIRDVNHDNLVSIIHGWESGLDASPAYDPAYGIKADNPHPSFWELYPKFTELVVDYNFQFHWNQTAILSRKKATFGVLDGYFIVQDVGVNSVYAAGWGLLGDLAKEFDSHLAAYCKKHQQQVERAIITKFWKPELNRFLSSTYKDQDGIERECQIETVQSLFPLILESLPKSIVQTIVHSQLLNTSKFWLQYPIPSVSASAAQFTPDFTVDLMWRGPTWPILNWFVMEGLERHKVNPDVMRKLMNRWIALYKLSGVWEQYNPITGQNYGAIGLGMSTLIVDWLFRMGLYP
jgi:hypothetical protein